MLSLGNVSKKINQIKFELLSPEDIRKMSVVQVETPDTYDSDGYPIENGLMDPHMGVLDPHLRCHTCGDKGGDCAGHFGSIELAKPIIHCGFSDIIHKMLRSTCNYCGRLLLSDEDILEYTQKLSNAIKNKENIEDILKKIQNETKKVEMNESMQEDIVKKVMDEIYPENKDIGDEERVNTLLNILNQLHTEAYMKRDEYEDRYWFKYIDPKQLCPHCRKNQPLDYIESNYYIIEEKNVNAINKIKEDIQKSIDEELNKKTAGIDKKINGLESNSESNIHIIEDLEREKAQLTDEFNVESQEKFKKEFKKNIESFVKEYIQNLVQEPIIFDEPTTFSQGDYKLTASEVKERLKRISNEDAFILGINTDVSRPEWMVLDVLPISPITVRPSITIETGERKEDDLTHKLVDVLRINRRLIENMEAGAPQLIIEDLWDLLQYHVTTYIDNNADGVPPSTHRSGRKLDTLMQRFKGKEGRFRANLSGKYVEFSARSVITPDPNIGINEVGVPEIIAKEITVPLMVNENNLDYAKKFIENASESYPGSKSIMTKFGIVRKVNNQTKEYILENLEPGDVIERHLIDGDVVLLNRQPSLHRMSVMAHKVKIHQNKSIAINPCVTPPYNADFDGDEMNIHILRNIESRAEAKSLMSVEENFISPRYGGPIIGAIRDFISGTFLLTKSSTEFSQEEALQILRKSRIEIPPFKSGNWILKYGAKYAEESFIYKKKGEKWTGKELFSLLLPNDLNLQFDSKLNETSEIFDDENYVRIEEGILKTGIIDENAIGAFSGHLLDKLAKEYGFKIAQIFLEKVSLLSINIFMKFGITNSLHDYEIPNEIQEKINKYLEHTEHKVSVLMKNFKLKNGFLSQTSDDLESYVSQILGNARDYAGELCNPYFNVNNNFPFSALGRNSSVMAHTGASSSALNLTQITACVGQQSIRGQRLHRGYIDRTLPHFKRNDSSPKAHGFIKSSFMQGLDPIEYYFHAMGGRESEVDKYVRTAQSGYMQRRLIHALQDVGAYKDGIVKDANDNVIQIMYGDDGVDTAKSDFGNPADLDRLIDEIRIKDNMDDEKVSNFKEDYDKLIRLKEESDKLTKKLNRRMKHLPYRDDNEFPGFLDSIDKSEPEDDIVNDFKLILDRKKLEKRSDFKYGTYLQNIQRSLSKHLKEIFDTLNNGYKFNINFRFGDRIHPSFFITDEKKSVLLKYDFDYDNREIFVHFESNKDNLGCIRKLLSNEDMHFFSFNKKGKFILPIVLNSYAYDNLYKNIIIGDLINFLGLFDKINDFCDDNIVSDFKFILNNYGSESKKDFKDSTFRKHILQRLSKNLREILNDINYEFEDLKFHDRFRINFGRTEWVEYPNILFYTNNRVVRLRYVFNCYDSEVSIHLTPIYKNRKKFTEKIDMIKSFLIQNAIDFTISNDKLFKEDIILKTYSYDNLDEITIFNDLNKFLGLFEKINDFCNDNIVSDFRLVLDNYESEKRKDFKDNTFRKNISQRLSKHIKKILIDFNHNNRFRISFGIGRWINYPGILFYGKDNLIRVSYIFNCYDSEISIHLAPIYKDRKMFIENIKLIKNFLIQENIPFTFSDEKIFKESIILKTYSYDDLDEKIIQHDLDKFLDLFDKLEDILNDDIVGDFKLILNNYEFESKKDFNDSTFRKNIHLKLSEHIRDILIGINQNYSFRVDFGVHGRWPKYPSILFIDNNAFIRLIYIFNYHDSEISIHLAPTYKNRINFIEKVDIIKNLIFQENIDFKLSYDKFIRDSIILKTYSYDDLDKNIISNDLNEFLNLFDKINSVFNENVINDFKCILDNYESESNGKMGNSDFYNDMKRNLPKHLDNILNDFAPKYVSRISFGLRKWAEYPFVYITEKYAHKNNNKLLFNITFNCQASEIYIILRSNVRNRIQFRENLSKIKDLCIDEDINFGYGHQKPFKDSIILKTYKYDDLKENVFIKDLKKFIEVYERINKILESSLSSIVVRDFNEILDKYESEKRKDLKSSEFAFKLQNQFTKDMEDFVKSVLDNSKDKYSVRCSFGIRSWADKPIISIINENIFDSFQEGLHVNYTFDAKISKVFLSINPRSKNNEEYIELKKLLIEELNNSNLNSQKEFIVGENNIDEYSIILKEYGQENIDENALKSDLKYLLPLYSSLCEIYLKNMDSIKNSVTSKKEGSASTNILDSILNMPSNSKDIMSIKTNPFKYFNVSKYSNTIDDYEILFNDENMEKLENFDFTYDDYKKVLANIIKSFEASLSVIVAENNLMNDFISLSLRDKMLIFVKSFSNIEYKNIGNEYGYLKFNTIYIEERNSNPIIITTMIHELAHFILTEILEQTVMKILDTNRTPLIESYVCLTLQEDLWYILDEFCAHTVEGRFMPYGYQSYASYNYKKDEVSKSNSKQDINLSLTIANTFASDIKSILESFILIEFREEIKQEYYNSNEKRNEEGVNQEIEQTLNEEGLIEAMKTILLNGVEVCKNRIDELKRCMLEFEKYYGED